MHRAIRRPARRRFRGAGWLGDATALVGEVSVAATQPYWKHGQVPLRSRLSQRRARILHGPRQRPWLLRLTWLECSGAARCQAAVWSNVGLAVLPALSGWSTRCSRSAVVSLDALLVVDTASDGAAVTCSQSTT